MSKEYESTGPDPHRRQPADAAERHRRHAWAPIAGVRIDGVHSSPSRFHTSSSNGHRIGVAARDGRLRIAAHRSATGTSIHVRRNHSIPQD